jgi:hypothetical protein
MRRSSIMTRPPSKEAPGNDLRPGHPVNQKTYKATATRSWKAVAFGFGICGVSLATAVAVLLVDGPLPFVLTAVVVLAIFIKPTISTLVAALSYPKLQVDPRGMTMSVPGHQRRILWEHVSEVTVIPMSGLSDHGWLAVRPNPGVAKPAPHSRLPEWRPDLGAIKFCDLDLLGTSHAEALDHIKRAAGPLWTDSGTRPIPSTLDDKPTN